MVRSVRHRDDGRLDRSVDDLDLGPRFVLLFVREQTEIGAQPADLVHALAHQISVGTLVRTAKSCLVERERYVWW